MLSNLEAKLAFFLIFCHYYGMATFQFLHDAVSHFWVVFAPRRQKRPNIAKSTEPAVCPFCPGSEAGEEELFRIGGEPGDTNWMVRVLPNKYPFASIHEVIIHSPDHHKNVDEVPLENVVLLLQAYKARFLTHQAEGSVYIFNNHGIEGGESLPHPHSQLVVIPPDIAAPIPALPQLPSEYYETDAFRIFCPPIAQWPDEVWVAPKKQGEGFGAITDSEIADLALVLQRVVQLMDMRHGYEFPFNFYIHPGKQWYLRLIPRIKRLGGFEVGTGIFVNTQDPAETIRFIKGNFENPDVEKIQAENRAEYATSV